MESSGEKKKRKKTKNEIQKIVLVVGNKFSIIYVQQIAPLQTNFKANLDIRVALKHETSK